MTFGEADDGCWRLPRKKFSLGKFTEDNYACQDTRDRSCFDFVCFAGQQLEVAAIVAVFEQPLPLIARLMTC